jgi:hypothetical protein
MEFLFHPMTSLFVKTALWLIPIFMFIHAVRLLFPRFNGNTGEMTVGEILAQCSPHVLHDVIIPDAKGGTIRLEHVLLTTEGLLVVETSRQRGLIFGNPRDRHWTRQLGQSSHRFVNPLWQNQLHVKILQALNLGVPVGGRVVFTDQARFPKGRAPGVTQLASLRNDITKPLSGDTGTTHRGAWFRLKRLCVSYKMTKKVQPARISEKHAEEICSPLAYALLGFSVAWMFILWVDAQVEIPTPLMNATTSTVLPKQLAQSRIDETKTESHLVKAASSPSSQRIVGYRHEWVAGRSLEECLGPDRRFDSAVLRCRQGYQRRVPVLSD